MPVKFFWQRNYKAKQNKKQRTVDTTTGTEAKVDFWLYKETNKKLNKTFTHKKLSRYEFAAYEIAGRVKFQYSNKTCVQYITVISKKKTIFVQNPHLKQTKFLKKSKSI